MWHLKTKLGVFWVAPSVEKASSKKYYLGVNDQELGAYSDAELAARDVHNQCTGYFSWDSQPKVRVPEHITEWVEGEPKDWQ
jgi:hypothetical protein